MGRWTLGLLAFAACSATAPTAAAAAAAPGTVVFTSTRCDQGGVQYGATGDGRTVCRPSIFRMNPDGGGLARLTTGASPEDEGRRGGVSGDYDPAWSPDGEQIAFERQTAEGPGVTRIFVMNADGSNQRRLFQDAPPPFQNVKAVAWSPTGDAVAFEASTLSAPAGDASSAIFIADLATSAMRRVSPMGLLSMTPTLTPDGRRVVYFAEGTSGNPPYGVYSTSIDGSDTRPVTMGDIRVAANGLAFSPDGTHVALTCCGGSLHTARTNGTELTRRSERVAITPTWWSQGPTIFWSGNEVPDQGSRVAIYRLDLSGPGTPVQITDAVAFDTQPSAFSPGVPVADSQPPGVILEAQPESTASDRLNFLAFDASGLRKVEVSLARRSRGRCRFVRAGGRLGKARECKRPAYRLLPSVAAWDRRTGALPRGAYEARFRTRDGAGNVDTRPRRMRFALR